MEFLKIVIGWGLGTAVGTALGIYIGIRRFDRRR